MAITTKYGMPTLIELGSLEENAALCKREGFSFLELNMNVPTFQIEELEQKEELRKIAKRYGIYFTIHLEEALNICDFNRAVAAAYLDTVSRTIAVAKDIDIPILNMHMNHGVHFTLPDRKIALFEKYEGRYFEAIRAFRSLCETQTKGTELRITIENTDGYREFEKKAIEYLLESDCFGLTFDMGHSYEAGGKDIAFITKHKERLLHFHMHDADKTGCHLALGGGELPMYEIMSHIKNTGCRCVIETKTVAALRESVEWIKRRKIW